MHFDDDLAKGDLPPFKVDEIGEGVVDISSAARLFDCIEWVRRIALFGAVAAGLWAVVDDSLTYAVATAGLGGMYLVCRRPVWTIPQVLIWSLIPVVMAVAGAHRIY